MFDLDLLRHDHDFIIAWNNSRGANNYLHMLHAGSAQVEKGVILWYHDINLGSAVNDSHTLISGLFSMILRKMTPIQTMQYGLIDNECIHSLCHFQVNDDGFVDNRMEYPLLGSSHLIQYLSSGYKRGVKSWYDQITPGVLIPCCKMTPIHSYAWGVVPWYNEITLGVLISRSWWRHQMETFSALLAFCAGNSPTPVNSPHKGQWRGALMFTLICARINGWVNNREAGDLRRYRTHYDVIVMLKDDSYTTRNSIPSSKRLYWLCHYLGKKGNIVNMMNYIVGSPLIG